MHDAWEYRQSRAELECSIKNKEIDMQKRVIGLMAEVEKLKEKKGGK